MSESTNNANVDVSANNNNNNNNNNTIDESNSGNNSSSGSGGGGGGQQSVVDLMEFAEALRTFPSNILKTVLEIYHKREEIKKQQDKGFVSSSNTLSLTPTDDKFHASPNDALSLITHQHNGHDLLPVSSITLPHCLQQSHLYGDVRSVAQDTLQMDAPHLYYAHHHLFDQELITTLPYASSSSSQSSSYVHVPVPEHDMARLNHQSIVHHHQHSHNSHHHQHHAPTQSLPQISLSNSVNSGSSGNDQSQSVVMPPMLSSLSSSSSSSSSSSLSTSFLGNNNNNNNSNNNSNSNNNNNSVNTPSDQSHDSPSSSSSNMMMNSRDSIIATDEMIGDLHLLFNMYEQPPSLPPSPSLPSLPSLSSSQETNNDDNIENVENVENGEPSSSSSTTSSSVLSSPSPLIHQVSHRLMSLYDPMYTYESLEEQVCHRRCQPVPYESPLSSLLSLSSVISSDDDNENHHSHHQQRPKSSGNYNTNGGSGVVDDEHLISSSSSSSRTMNTTTSTTSTSSSPSLVTSPSIHMNHHNHNYHHKRRLPHQVTRKLMVTAEKLHLDVGDWEPMFLSMFLFDISTNQRTSEMFHCTFNIPSDGSKMGISKEMHHYLRLGMYHQHHQHSASSNGGKNLLPPHAMFTISETNPFLYMIVLGEKILQTGGSELYVNKKQQQKKKSAMSKKDEESVQARIREAWQCLDEFRQPLFWTCQPLFKSKSKTQTDIRKDLSLVMNHLNSSNNNNSGTGSGGSGSSNAGSVNSTPTYHQNGNESSEYVTTTSTSSTSSTLSTSTTYSTRDSFSGSTRVSLGSFSDMTVTSSSYTTSTSGSGSGGATALFAKTLKSKVNLVRRDSVGGSNAQQMYQQSLSPSSSSNSPSTQQQTNYGSTNSPTIVTSTASPTTVQQQQQQQTPSSPATASSSGSSSFEDALIRMKEEACQTMALVHGSVSFRRLYLLQPSGGKDRLNFCEMILQLTDESKRKGIKSIDGMFLATVTEIKSEEDLEKMLFNDDHPLASEQDLKRFEDRVEQRPKALRSSAHEIEDDFYDLCCSVHQVPSMDDHLQPHFAPTPFFVKYAHTLYIYPEEVNLASVGSKDARNIAIRVMLRKSDQVGSSSFNHEGLPVIASFVSRNYRCTNGDVRLMKTHEHSAVTYHEKNPQFFDEFRFDLPNPLDNKHHIVFEFYHVNCQQNKKPSGGSKKNSHHSLEIEPLTSIGNTSVNFVGYSILKLVSDNEDEPVRDGSFKLPIYKRLTQEYISHLDELDAYSSGKKLFQISVVMKSTLYPQETRAVNLIRYSDSLMESDRKSPSSPLSAPSPNVSSFFSKLRSRTAITSLNMFKSCNWKEVVPYAPAFINLLIYCMSNMESSQKRLSPLASLLANPASSNAPETLQGEPLNIGFEALIALLRGIYRRSSSVDSKRVDVRDRVLSSYIQYFYKNPQTCLTPVFVMLAERWEAYFDYFNIQEIERKSRVLNDLLPESNMNINSPSSPNPTLNKRGSDVKDTKSRKLRGLSVFARRKTISASKEYEEDDDMVTVRDTLQLSWFLFDLIIKSLTLSVHQDLTLNDFDWDMFFQPIRAVQGRVIETLIDIENEATSSRISQAEFTVDRQLVRRVNHNLALFIRDLLTISFSPQLQSNNKFRIHVYGMLEDYLLSTQIKQSNVMIQMRLEFIEVLADHEHLIKFAANTSTHFITNYILTVILKSMKGTNVDSKSKAVSVLTHILTMLDFDSQYCDEKSRDIISELFMPMVDCVINDLDTYTRDMTTVTLEQFVMCILHILRNRNKEGLQTLWQNRTPLFLSSFVKMLTLILTTISLNMREHSSDGQTTATPTPFKPRTYLRISCKIVVLEVMRMFLDDMKEKIRSSPGIYTVTLESIILLFVKYFDGTRDDADLNKHSFLPLFCDLVKYFAKTISMSGRDNRWKWSMGILLKYTDFPPKNDPYQSMYSECIRVLLEQYESRLNEMMGSVKQLVLEEDSPTNIIVENNTIKAATIDKLIERVTTSTSQFDPKFIEVFFLTYRSFVKSTELLEKLIQRFHMASQLNDTDGLKTSLRSSNAIKLWVDRYFMDFDNVLICRLLQFMEEIAALDRFKTYCSNLKKALSFKMIRDDEKISRATMFSGSLPTPILPRDFTPYGKFQLLEWSSLELAKQLTLMDSEVFKRIEPKEFMGGAWTKRTKYINAPNLVALTDRWNKLSDYVAATVLNADDIKLRRTLIAKFLDIANEMLKLNNFNGMTAINSGLHNTAMNRLKKTYEGLSPEAAAIRKKLQELSDPLSSSKNMRDAFKEVFGPCVPPIHIYLKDLIFMDDGNDASKQGMVNVTKIRLMSAVIIKIRVHQQTPYPIEPIPYVRDQFISVLFKNLPSEDDMWKRSLIVEPRAQQ